MLTLVLVGIVLFNTAKVHTRSVGFERRDKWESGHHPFPEMDRFLNSYSHIHQHAMQRAALMRRNRSFPRYICSISTNRRRIDEVLRTFGEKYRPLINKIIDEDCPVEYLERRRDKRSESPSRLSHRWLRARASHDPAH